MNMLRVPGGTVYEDERFFDACDRAGILVWQESMLGMLDPPDDEGFVDVGRGRGHRCPGPGRPPSLLAVLCGGQELEEQPAMFGLPRERWTARSSTRCYPTWWSSSFPGLPYVPSSPTGGDLPFQARSGVSHYFGVGSLPVPAGRPPTVRPPVREPRAWPSPSPRAGHVDEEVRRRPHGPAGGGVEAAVHRDAGSWFDLEDVRDHYARRMFGADMAVLWRTIPSGPSTSAGPP